MWPDSWRLDHGLVERPPRAGRHVTDRIGDDREHHPLLDLVLAGAVALERAAQGAGLDLGEVAELADVDAEDVGGRAAEQLHRPQHRAVATEADGQVGLARRARIGQVVEVEGGGVLAAASRPSKPWSASHLDALSASAAASARSWWATITAPLVTGSPRPRRRRARPADRRAGAERVDEELHVAVRAAQGRFHPAHDGRPSPRAGRHRRGTGRPGGPRDRGPRRALGTTSARPASNWGFTRSTSGARVRRRPAAPGARPQGDEREVGHHQVDRTADRVLRQVPHVGALEDVDPRVVPQAGVELAVADVDGDHLRRAPLQEAVGEAPGRGPGVEGAARRGRRARTVERGVELLAAPADEAGRRAQEPTGSPGGDQVGRLARDRPADGHEVARRWPPARRCGSGPGPAGRARRRGGGGRSPRSHAGSTGGRRSAAGGLLGRRLLGRGLLGRAARLLGRCPLGGGLLRPAVFLAVGFLAVVFLAVDFLAVLFLAVDEVALDAALADEPPPVRMPTRAASSSTRASRSDRSTPIDSSCLVTSRWMSRIRLSVFSRPRAIRSCTVACASSTRSCPASCRSFAISSALAWDIWVKLRPASMSRLMRSLLVICSSLRASRPESMTREAPPHRRPTAHVSR